MAVIGTGQAHGACSLLHAAGTGYGAAISLDLPVIVKALDRPCLLYTSPSPRDS